MSEGGSEEGKGKREEEKEKEKEKEEEKEKEKEKEEEKEEEEKKERGRATEEVRSCEMSGAGRVARRDPVCRKMMSTAREG